MKTREEYEKEYAKKERELDEIKAWGGRSPARENRLEEIEKILGYLDMRKEYKELKAENEELKEKLKRNGL